MKFPMVGAGIRDYFRVRGEPVFPIEADIGVDAQPLLLPCPGALGISDVLNAVAVHFSQQKTLLQKLFIKFLLHTVKFLSLLHLL